MKCKARGKGICGSVFATESGRLEGELGEQMSSGRALRGEMASGVSERERRREGGWGGAMGGGAERAGESPDEGVEMMGWQFPTTRLFFRAVKHIVRHCLKCPG